MEPFPPAKRFSPSTPNGSRVHSSYFVRHLKSFTISPACVPLHTEDALRLLEKAGTIEARQHYVHIETFGDAYDLVIRDGRNDKEEVERFPMKCLRAPRARVVLSEDGHVNQLFLFTVEAFSLPNNEPEMHEMHVFQVLNCTAKDIVDDMLAAGMKPNYTMFTFISPQGYFTPCEHPLLFRGPTDETDNTDISDYWEFSTDWLNAECSLLNYCFDDIENGLQSIRSKVQGKTCTVFGSLSRSMHKRFVSLEEEIRKDSLFRIVVIDFFQKIRFAIILLSRVNGFLPEPKAPLLVAQLFNILSECIGHCKTSKRCKYFFPSTVTVPEFPQYTLDYLDNNLSAEHRSVLKTLGNAWHTPRENLGCKSVYIPRFQSGFTVILTQYDPSLFQFNSPNFDPDPTRHYMQPVTLTNFARGLLHRKQSVAKVNKQYVGQESSELCLKKGEFVEILEHQGDTYRVRVESGNVGSCPGSILSHIQRYTPDHSD